MMYEHLKDCYVYVANPETELYLLEELGNDAICLNHLIFSPKKLSPPVFALDIWEAPEIHRIESISKAAGLLRKKNKYWYNHVIEKARRTQLIQAELKTISSKTITFPPDSNAPKSGVFSLLDQDHLLLSASRWKTVPDGICRFEEDKIYPPNRAYLKLWESLSLLNRYPTAGETVIDLGASPGGFTYVAAHLGAQVIAVDKAPLAPRIARMKNVDYREASAFSLNPSDFPAIDWLFCDVACYPDRLYRLVNDWLSKNPPKQMICTIKLQGKTDFENIALFQQMPNSLVTHLSCNKHEAMFFYPAPASLSLNFSPISFP